ncbi:MAG: MBL fold metallo-hydrolase [Ruminiclostridium sp.]|nr:MBL fold metallo-hydrolase [Ruminiclostridium sp.]
MDIIQLVLSPLATNCYIVPTGAGEAVVIDPADDEEKILDTAAKAGLAIKKILLTHGHFDHIGGAAYIKEQTGAPIYIHKADTELLTDPVKALAFFCPGKPFVSCEPDVLFDNGDVIKQGSLEFTVMSTPGHTAGSVCFLCSDGNGNDIMFAGDTIFKDSIGRSDGYSGDPEVQLRTLDKLKELEKDYIIYPGHGESTTLSAEKRYNPFLSDGLF